MQAPRGALRSVAPENQAFYISYTRLTPAGSEQFRAGTIHAISKDASLYDVNELHR